MRIAIAAGESSGDALGASLIDALVPVIASLHFRDAAMAAA